jgi:hypothetical protein
MQGLSKSKGLFLFQAHNSWIYNAEHTSKTTIAYDANPNRPLLALKIVIMKRVYRLLRDNLETGPFTIDELLGQQLKSDDMLWIEGRSTAWCYLSEIELSLSIEPDSSSKKLPVYRNDDIEMRADEIRKKVLNFKPQTLPVRGK